VTSEIHALSSLMIAASVLGTMGVILAQRRQMVERRKAD
jgi:hypothetical protein